MASRKSGCSSAVAVGVGVVEGGELAGQVQVAGPVGGQEGLPVALAELAVHGPPPRQPDAGRQVDQAVLAEAVAASSRLRTLPVLGRTAIALSGGWPTIAR